MGGRSSSNSSTTTTTNQYDQRIVVTDAMGVVLGANASIEGDLTYSDYGAIDRAFTASEDATQKVKELGSSLVQQTGELLAQKSESDLQSITKMFTTMALGGTAIVGLLYLMRKK